MIKQVVAIAFIGLFTSQSHAASITNGDFGTCDFTGWSQFSDLDPIDAGDFTIENNGGDCSAVIAADASDAFSNILFQELDLSVAAGNEIVLSLDIEVDSELTGQPLGFADYFAVYLFDGAGSFLDHTGAFGGMFDNIDIDGPMSYVQEFVLDTSFYNTSGWFLEFQVVSNLDFAPAFLTINSVDLFERTTGVDPVSAPSMFAFAMLVAAVMFVRKRIR